MKFKLLFSSLLLMLLSLVSLHAAPTMDLDNNRAGIVLMDLQATPQAALVVTPQAAAIPLPLLSHRPGRSIAKDGATGSELYQSSLHDKSQDEIKIISKYQSPAFYPNKESIKRNRKHRRFMLRQSSSKRLVYFSPPGYM